MKNLKTIAVLVLLSAFVRAQDSAKVLTHEIGFNTIRILSQFSKLNTNGVAQLPYDVFYNLYYKNKVGLRVGAGSTTSYNEDEVDKQQYPAITKSNSINLRVGGTYNYSSHGRITLNAFADFVYKKTNTESISSTTTQVFPDPVVTHYDKESTVVTGMGFQVGTGIKYNFYKQLSLYFELPFTFMREKISENNLVKETGIDNVETNLNSRHFSSYFTLPATMYLVLRF